MSHSPALTCQACSIDADCIGERWVVADLNELAAFVAIVAMGQASQAAHILEELIPATPAFSTSDLRNEAIVKLTIQKTPSTPRTGYPKIQRDGYIFEIVSWLAAKTYYGNDVLLKNPHISATTQGLDGFMLELNPSKSDILSTTVFEDKCSDHPRKTFLQSVIKTFQDRNDNLRSAEIIDAAGTLLSGAGLSSGAAAALSAAVTDKSKRNYRAAFSVSSTHDSLASRQALFANFDRVTGIDASQRIGASFVSPGDMRTLINEIATKAIAYIHSL